MSVQTQTTSFKLECWQAVHDLTTDTLKIALYDDTASLDQTTTAYNTTAEVVAAGYTAGGQILTGVTLAASGFVAYVDFAAPSWNAVLTARYALIYNSNKANRSVAVLDFGGNKTSTAVFALVLPANTPSSAILRSSN